jgi:hypothetical protein
MTRYFDYLSNLGVRVHSPGEWAVALDPSEEHLGHAFPFVRFHTTQDRVWIDGVEAKKRLIRQGGTPCVTTIDAPEFERGDMWVSNGHHTLAAYLVLKKRPYVRCFSPYVPTSLETVAPRYLCTDGRRMVPDTCPSHPQFQVAKPPPPRASARAVSPA